jgi:hypothetical protein
MNRFGEISIVFIGLLVLLSARTCESFNEDPDKIRVAVKLKLTNIPALNGAVETRGGEKPWILKAGWSSEVFNFVKFEYRWEKSDSDFVFVDFLVFENHELANIYLTEKREYSSLPIELHPPEDQPAIAGNISYGNGENFIRGNIVVEIRAEGAFSDKTPEIASQIDALILEGPRFHALSQVKPSVEFLGITENPVTEGTQTLIKVNVNDPNNKKLFYKWIHTIITGRGGNVVEGEYGDLYYQANAVYDDILVNEEELSVLVINEYGFCSDTSSALYIKTIEE